MSSRQETRRKIESTQLLFFSQAQTPSTAEIAQRSLRVTLWFAGEKYYHNNQSNIDIFTGDNNKSVFAATTNAENRLSQISAGALIVELWR